MKHRISFHRLGIVWAILTLTLSSCSGRPGTLTGTVTQVEDGKPVAGAEILVFELEQVRQVNSMDVYQKTDTVHRQVTDANGAFSVSLKPDRYLVEVKIRGVKVTSRMVQVKAGRTLTSDFQITAPAP